MLKMRKKGRASQSFKVPGGVRVLGTLKLWEPFVGTFPDSSSPGEVGEVLNRSKGLGTFPDSSSPGGDGEVLNRSKGLGTFPDSSSPGEVGEVSPTDSNSDELLGIPPLSNIWTIRRWRCLPDNRENTGENLPDFFAPALARAFFYFNFQNKEEQIIETRDKSQCLVAAKATLTLTIPGCN